MRHSRPSAPPSPGCPRARRPCRGGAGRESTTSRFASAGVAFDPCASTARGSSHSRSRRTAGGRVRGGRSWHLAPAARQSQNSSITARTTKAGSSIGDGVRRLGRSRREGVHVLLGTKVGGDPDVLGGGVHGLPKQRRHCPCGRSGRAVARVHRPARARNERRRRDEIRPARDTSPSVSFGRPREQALGRDCSMSPIPNTGGGSAATSRHGGSRSGSARGSRGPATAGRQGRARDRCRG